MFFIKKKKRKGRGIFLVPNFFKYFLRTLFFYHLIFFHGFYTILFLSSLCDIYLCLKKDLLAKLFFLLFYRSIPYWDVPLRSDYPFRFFVRPKKGNASKSVCHETSFHPKGINSFKREKKLCFIIKKHPNRF